MKTILFLCLLIPFHVFALTLEGQVSVDGEDHKFKQSIELGKEYLFPMNTFSYKITVTKAKNKKFKARFNLFEGKNLVTQGEETISDKSKDFYKKGEVGQPNTIITLKVSDK